MPLHLLDSHSEERPISAQSYLRGCYRAGLGEVAVETIGSKWSYALTWCMLNNDDDDNDDDDVVWALLNSVRFQEVSTLS